MIVPMLAGVALAAPAHARRCPRFISSKEVKLDHFAIDFTNEPQRDRPPYPDVRAGMTCRVGTTGRLRDCGTSLRDERGPWLVNQVERLRLVKRKPGGCPLGGRFYHLVIRFEHTD
ncbi:MAG: hypothetical protein ACTHJR_16435 [Sphingomonas sp.]|uniref:hypothetical protein n=1 Tax=Sphingomonas sp. TaxID=28214 RepID=UPI003F80A06F